MPELTIASYNIHWGRQPKRTGSAPFDVVAAFRQLDADVVVIQESWAPDDGPADHERVADALDMRVVCDVSLARAIVDPEPHLVVRERSTSARARRRPSTGAWHLAALSRVPVTDARVIPLPHLWFDHADRAVLAFAAVDGPALEVRGTHFAHLEYGAHLSTRGLRRALPPSDQPAVLIGDMNMWGWSIERMVPRGWRRVVHGKTWPSHRPMHQIDHLLVTDEVDIVWGEVGPDLGSDHLPIRARVRWG